MYNFTNFAMSLNELQPGMEAILAPTDCRLRPDIRAMENGDISKFLNFWLLFSSVVLVAAGHCFSKSAFLFEIKLMLIDALLVIALLKFGSLRPCPLVCVSESVQSVHLSDKSLEHPEVSDVELLLNITVEYNV